MKKLSDLQITAIATIGLLAVFAWASRSDFNDEVVCEMKNVGVYDSLSEAHPDFTDEQLVGYYLAERDK